MSAKRHIYIIVDGVLKVNPNQILIFEGTNFTFGSYIPFKKFSFGNLHRSLKLVCADLLLKFNQDPN